MKSETSPDAKPCSVAEVAWNDADGGHDADGGVFEEGPKGVGGEAEASDAIGGPDAEGASAAVVEAAVAAEDAVSAAGLALRAGVVESLEIAVLDEAACVVAVWARRQFELLDDGEPLLGGAVEAWKHGDVGA